MHDNSASRPTENKCELTNPINQNSTFTVEKCITAYKLKKNKWKLAFWISRSFKVITVALHEKLIKSACYGKQQVWIYLQPFSC